ncbi:hypothetical protein ACFV23_41875, partial [Streptomyces sp. NPDC059627]
VPPVLDSCAPQKGDIVYPAEGPAVAAHRGYRSYGPGAPIAEAVGEGLRLDEARRRFGYAKPWEGPADSASRHV